MENTTHLNLKKPDYTDFADIKDINDNMDKIDEELAAPTGDTADSTATFTCSDVADGDAAAWTNVPALTSGETHKSIFAKMSQMFKNIRYLYKLLGTTDISSIGNGTVTGGLSSLNDSFANSGRLYADYKSTTIPANTWNTGASVTVPAGTYILIYRAHSSTGWIRVGNSSNGGAWTQSTSANSTAEFVIAMTTDSQTIFQCYLFSQTAGTYGNGIIAVKIK